MEQELFLKWDELAQAHQLGEFQKMNSRSLSPI